MHRNPRHLEAHSQFHRGQQVGVDGVYAAGAEQPEQVERAAVLAEPSAELDQRGDLEKFAGADARRNADEVLRDHPSCPEVQVPHLAVAHLPLGQPHCQAAGVEQGPRGALPEAMPDRRPGELDGVPVTLRAVAPTVQDHEDHLARGVAAV